MAPPFRSSSRSSTTSTPATSTASPALCIGCFAYRYDLDSRGFCRCCRSATVPAWGR